MNLASSNLLQQIIAALESLDGFSPYLRRQIEWLRSALVPVASALQKLRLGGIHTFCYLTRDEREPICCISVLNGIIDVFVAALLQGLPDVTLFLEILLRGGLLNAVEKEGQDAVLAYVFRDVFLGVVGSHLGTVVDVLLKNVAQHVGVDVFARCCDAGIQMPAPFIEEIEEVKERLIINVNILEHLFDVMKIEHASVQIGYAAIFAEESLVTLVSIQSFMEEVYQETLVE